MTDKYPLSPSYIEKIADIMNSSDLEEVIITSDNVTLEMRIKGTSATILAPAASAMPAPAVVATGPTVSASPAPSEPANGYNEADMVRSPMVGTAYLSPKPGESPFIVEGGAVKQGQTLFIIEAMKVMNTISAPKDGVVQKILIDDAEPVEFDEALVVII